MECRVTGKDSHKSGRFILCKEKGGGSSACCSVVSCRIFQRICHWKALRYGPYNAGNLFFQTHFCLHFPGKHSGVVSDSSGSRRLLFRDKAQKGIKAFCMLLRRLRLSPADTVYGSFDNEQVALRQGVQVGIELPAPGTLGGRILWKKERIH